MLTNTKENVKVHEVEKLNFHILHVCVVGTYVVGRILPQYIIPPTTHRNTRGFSSFINAISLVFYVRCVRSCANGYHNTDYTHMCICISICTYTGGYVENKFESFKYMFY